MQPEVASAIIHASGTVLAATIGSLSVLALAIHRKWVTRLARAVEAYHQLETAWVRMHLGSAADSMTDKQISVRRGNLRKKLMPDCDREFMNAREARRIRRRYLSFD